MDLQSLPKSWVVTSGQFTRTTHNAIYPAIMPEQASNSLLGKTAVVSGASRGIGAKGIVPALARAGIKTLILVATDIEKLMQTEMDLKRLSPKLEVMLVQLDIASDTDVKEAWARINSKYPKIEILVNNAGVESTTPSKPIHQQDPEVFFRNFEVNVKGTHMMTQSFLEAATHWASSSEKASVINITSSTAWGTWPFLAAYSMSKAANIQYTALLAAAYSEILHVVAVNPGLNDTDILPAALREVGFDCNSPLLTGGVLVWLLANPVRSRFLNGRVITSEWDVDELVARADDIVQQDLLTIKLNAVLGQEQFM